MFHFKSPIKTFPHLKNFYILYEKGKGVLLLKKHNRNCILGKHGLKICEILLTIILIIALVGDGNTKRRLESCRVVAENKIF